METRHQTLINQVFSLLSSEGSLRKSLQLKFEQYDNLSGISIFIQIFNDFWDGTEQSQNGIIGEERVAIQDTRILIFKTLIQLYSYARNQSSEVAFSLFESFFMDYLHAPESCLLPRWCSLSQADFLSKEIIGSRNQLSIWQAYKQLFQSYNEFLDGLFSYLVILCRISKGRNVDSKIFDLSYANKLAELRGSVLTEIDGSQILFDIAQPKIRNSVAHQNIWLGTDNINVHYIEGHGQDRKESSIKLEKFMEMAALGSHISHIYLAAIATIYVLEYGSATEKQLIFSKNKDIFTALHC